MSSEVLSRCFSNESIRSFLSMMKMNNLINNINQQAGRSTTSAVTNTDNSNNNNNNTNTNNNNNNSMTTGTPNQASANTAIAIAMLERLPLPMLVMVVCTMQFNHCVRSAALAHLSQRVPLPFISRIMMAFMCHPSGSQTDNQDYHLSSSLMCQVAVLDVNARKPMPVMLTASGQHYVLVQPNQTGSWLAFAARLCGTRTTMQGRQGPKHSTKENDNVSKDSKDSNDNNDNDDNHNNDDNALTFFRLNIYYSSGRSPGPLSLLLRKTVLVEQGKDVHELLATHTLRLRPLVINPHNITTQTQAQAQAQTNTQTSSTSSTSSTQNTQIHLYIHAIVFKAKSRTYSMIPPEPLAQVISQPGSTSQPRSTTLSSSQLSSTGAFLGEGPTHAGQVLYSVYQDPRVVAEVRLPTLTVDHVAHVNLREHVDIELLSNLQDIMKTEQDARRAQAVKRPACADDGDFDHRKVARS
jgi:hypothetical protein